jgi:hypothetical protein
MANVKISELNAASTPLAGTEVLPIVQSSATVKVSVANLTAGRAISALTLNSLTVGLGAGSVATNTAVGLSALAANTTGANNTALGYQALTSNTTSSANTAVGYQAAYSSTSGFGDVNAFGWRALYSNTTGYSNTAMGSEALRNNTTASFNTAVGYQAGYTSTGQRNAFFGSEAGYANTTGESNTYIGRQAGNLMTSGSNNTIIGRYNGNQGSLDIRTASNYIVLSDGDGNPRGIFDGSGNFLVGAASQFVSEKLSVITGNTVGIGVKTTGGSSNATVGCWNATTSGDSNFIFFATETSITVRGSITYNRAAGLTSYNITSDYRAKDITGPVTSSGALIDSVPVYMGTMKGATQERPMFIAHEVPAYARTGEKDAVDADGNPVYQQMDASALIPVMWAEIQSLRQRLSAANL